MSDQAAKQIRSGLFVLAAAIVLAAVVMKWPIKPNSPAWIIRLHPSIQERFATATNSQTGEVRIYRDGNWNTAMNPFASE